MMQSKEIDKEKELELAVYHRACRVRIDALKEFFATAEFKNDVEVAPGNIVRDGKMFVESHLKVVEENYIKRWALPFYERLVTYKNKLINIC